MRIRNTGILIVLITALAASPLLANGKITTPKEHFGFDIGADYQLLNYTELVEYWQKLEQESDRMKLVEIGTTAEGRTMIMAIITSPQNHQNLERYKEISSRLAHAEGLTDDQARELAAEGKAVVWIDGGLHATEVVNAQAEFETVYQMLSRNDAETMRFLDDVICSQPSRIPTAWSSFPTGTCARAIPRNVRPRTSPVFIRNTSVTITTVILSWPTCPRPKP